MRPRSLPSLRDLVAEAGAGVARRVEDECRTVNLAGLAGATSLDVPLAALAGRSVLLMTGGQLAAAVALIELDGVARRVVLCPPGLPAAAIPWAIETARIDAVLMEPGAPPPAGALPVLCRPEALRPVAPPPGTLATEWILFTSGTTGMPKMVVHTLATLLGPLAALRQIGPGAVWSTFYDIRRYGGLQILLRALAGGGSLVLSCAGEPPAAFLGRVAAAGVSHISGTPSHWRLALMSPAARVIAPRYVRLSGEVADQGIIDRLRAQYPGAAVAHAFASTEAGVAFDVGDGLAGFPARLVGREEGPVALRVVDGTLRIRSGRVALGYLGAGRGLTDADGFADTGDVVDLHGDRYRFAGRREGIINVGGQKVHPEEVEAVINRHPDVEMSLVGARPNPITGAIVVAEVVPRPSRLEVVDNAAAAVLLRREIMALCGQSLARHQAPAMLRFVRALKVGAAGKLARARA